MKKGFSLIELIVVVALIGILLSVASLSSRTLIEKRALEEAKNKIELALRGTAERSYNDGEEYKITLDYSDKSIVVKDSDSNVEGSLELPDILEYTTISSSDAKLDFKEITVKPSGWVEAFTVYIFDNEENARYRISVGVPGVSNISHVNVYENISNPPTWESVDTYNYTNNKSDWTKE